MDNQMIVRWIHVQYDVQVDYHQAVKLFKGPYYNFQTFQIIQSAVSLIQTPYFCTNRNGLKPSELQSDPAEPHQNEILTKL